MNLSETERRRGKESEGWSKAAEPKNKYISGRPAGFEVWERWSSFTSPLMKHPAPGMLGLPWERGRERIIQPLHWTRSDQAPLTREIIYMPRQVEDKLHGWETQAIAEAMG